MVTNVEWERADGKKSKKLGSCFDKFINREKKLFVLFSQSLEYAHITNSDTRYLPSTTTTILTPVFSANIFFALFHVVVQGFRENGVGILCKLCVFYAQEFIASCSLYLSSRQYSSIHFYFVRKERRICTK